MLARTFFSASLSLLLPLGGCTRVATIMDWVAGGRVMSGLMDGAAVMVGVEGPCCQRALSNFCAVPPPVHGWASGPRVGVRFNCHLSPPPEL